VPPPRAARPPPDADGRAGRAPATAPGRGARPARRCRCCSGDRAGSRGGHYNPAPAMQRTGIALARHPVGWAVAAYVLLAVVWASPSSLSPADTVPDLGDPLHLAWTMAWDAHQVVRHPGA